MREALDQWDYVAFAYVAGLVPLVGLIAWSWLGMTRAEQRRNASRDRQQDRREGDRRS